MPLKPPPNGSMLPRHSLLPAGSLLWRVHLEAWKPNEFNSTVAHSPFVGGRFDGDRDDPYPFLYVGSSEAAALTEVLVRGWAADPDGNRFLPYEAVQGRCLSALETTHELRLVSLVSGQDLAAIAQDSWLSQAEPREYIHTRYWARWLRTISSGQGLVWQSNYDRPSAAYVLFGDRCDPGLAAPVHSHSIPLYTGAGLIWLNDRLRPYRVRVEPPI